MSTITIPKMFKQFFTPKKYSQTMINELNTVSPHKVIDLSMGEASLLKEAKKRWQNTVLVGNDIDEKCCSKIKKSFPNIKNFNLDVFDKKTIPIIIDSIGKVDLCLGNPPFHLIKQNESTQKILSDYNLEKSYNSLTIPAEVIFILQCLKILSEGGVMSLILPDGFFVNTYLKKFRKFLLLNYKIEKVIELPSHIFEKTDAKTHILVIKNKKEVNKKIKLMNSNSFNEVLISPNEAIERMDYSFYENSRKYKEYSTLSSLDMILMRGKPKYLISGIKDRHILHTTNFSKGSTFSNSLRSKKQLLKYEGKIAIPGDIIIARVGTYCIGNIGIVEKGYFVATDCIFIIRIENINIRKKIFSILTSSEGQSWIKANAKGVSAKHITIEDFKKFPLFEIKECHGV